MIWVFVKKWFRSNKDKLIGADWKVQTGIVTLDSLSPYSNTNPVENMQDIIHKIRKKN